MVLSLKRVTMSIFDYYLNFNRPYFLTLLGSVLLITIYALLLILLTSYSVNSVQQPNLTFSYLFRLSGGIDSWLFEKANILLIIVLLTYALLAKYFISFSKKNPSPNLMETIKTISKEKVYLYVLFLFVFGLFEFYPNPIYSNYSNSFFGESQGSYWLFWFYGFVQFLLHFVAILSAYILIHKDRVSITELGNEWRHWLSGAVLIFILDAIILSVNNGIQRHFGSLLTIFVESYWIEVFIIGSVQLLFLTLIVPAKVVALSYSSEQMEEPIELTTKEESDTIESELDEI